MPARLRLSEGLGAGAEARKRMPDMERITDSLYLELERDPLRKMWRRGFIAGKTRARIEVAVIAAVLYFGIALLGILTSA